MRTRTLVIVLVLTALFLTTTFAMRGSGHRVMRMMTAIHGR
jgi:predicted small secreted protein